jgi:Anti-sigma-K factor rskA
MPPPEHDDHDEHLLRAIRSEAPDPADAGDHGADPGRTRDAELARLGRIVRSLSDDDVARDEPPPAVWEGIAARAGGAPGVEPDLPGPPRVPEAGTSRAPASDVGAPPGVPDVPAVPPGGATVPPPEAATGAVPLRARRRPGPPRWLLGAAAAAAALVIVVAVVATWGGDDEPTVVASAQLEPLPGQPVRDEAQPVEARVFETDDGLELDLPLSGLPTPAGFYEVWLIDPNVEGMVSLGPARADGRYAVPADIDVAAFPIVDVSVEPPDGVPTHSGVSVLRGTLA